MNNHIIRNQLQLKARELLSVYFHCDKTDKTALTALAAAIDCYLDIRNKLAPYVGTDGYMQELAGASFKIGAAIKGLDNPPAQQPEQPKADAGKSYFVVTVLVQLTFCRCTFCPDEFVHCCKTATHPDHFAASPAFD